MSRPHLALVGATASGKSALALDIARNHPDIELVSIDSMQVYRGMDIGTAKPSKAERAEVPHHLIDLADPWERFTVARFKDAFKDALAGIESRGHRALLVGGTGLYLRAVIDDLDIPKEYPAVRAELEAEPDTAALHGQLANLDPTAAQRMESANRRRVIRALEVTLGSGKAFSSYGPGLEAYPPTHFALIGVERQADEIAARIEARYRRQLEQGFVDEVRSLSEHPQGLSATARQALGYRELLTHVEDGVDLAAAVVEAITRTRRFARRQRAWFHRDPRIRWHGPDDIPGRLIEACG